MEEKKMETSKIDQVEGLEKFLEGRVWPGKHIGMGYWSNSCMDALAVLPEKQAAAYIRDEHSWENFGQSHNTGVEMRKVIGVFRNGEHHEEMAKPYRDGSDPSRDNYARSYKAIETFSIDNDIATVIVTSDKEKKEFRFELEGDLQK
jgi:hypothetical protein